jgi:hypothetical protein
VPGKARKKTTNFHPASASGIFGGTNSSKAAGEIKTECFQLIIPDESKMGTSHPMRNVNENEIGYSAVRFPTTTNTQY